MNAEVDSKNRRLVAASFAVVLGMLLSGSARSEKGRVLDQHTGHPIPGAHVYARWTGEALNPVHSVTRCYFFATARSGPLGEYELAEPHPSALRFGLIHDERKVSAYAPGYVLSVRKIASEPGTVFLLRDPRTNSERIEGLMRLHFDTCFRGEKPTILGPLYADIAEETARLAISEVDRRNALALKARADRIALDPDEYERRRASGEYRK